MKTVEILFKNKNFWFQIKKENNNSLNIFDQLHFKYYQNIFQLNKKKISKELKHNKKQNVLKKDTSKFIFNKTNILLKKFCLKKKI